MFWAVVVWVSSVVSIAWLFFPVRWLAGNEISCTVTTHQLCVLKKLALNCVLYNTSMCAVCAEWENLVYCILTPVCWLFPIETGLASCSIDSEGWCDWCTKYYWWPYALLQTMEKHLLELHLLSMGCMHATLVYCGYTYTGSWLVFGVRLPQRTTTLY